MLTVALVTALASVLAAEPASAAGTLEHVPYGKTRGGQAVDIFAMTKKGERRKPALGGRSCRARPRRGKPPDIRKLADAFAGLETVAGQHYNRRLRPQRLCR
jgi:hypothetical protein